MAARPTRGPSVPATYTTSGEQPAKVTAFYQIPGESYGYLFNWHDTARDFGATLARQGVYLHGAMFEATDSVVSGGNKSGTLGLGFGVFGTDIDTDAAFGLPGGLIDFTVSTQWGDAHDGYNQGGAFETTPYAFGTVLGLQSLYYDQKLFGGFLHITLGRMSATASFPFSSPNNLSPGFDSAQWHCTFFTFTCEATEAYNSNSVKNSIYWGSWGGVATFHPAPSWYVKTGVYEAEPTLGDNLEGWPGASWGLDRSTGAFLPVQVGYVTSPATSLYPTDFYAGGYYDTAKVKDQLYNVTHDSNAGLNAQITQMVWRFSSDKRSVRGLSVFGSVEQDLTRVARFQQQFDFGVLIRGPFASRSADTLNLLGWFTNFDPRYVELREATARRNHAAYRMHGAAGLEVNYGVAVAPGLTVSPYVQYISHPNQNGLTIPNPNDTNVVAVGINAFIRFNSLFGLPQLPAG